MKTRRSILSLLLVFVMVLSLLPGGAVAVAADETTGSVIEQQDAAAETENTALPENTDGAEGDEGTVEPTETPTPTETPVVPATPTSIPTESMTDTEQSSNPVETVYTVTFEVNGGSEVEAQQVKDGETAEEPENPTKEGFTFGGWFEDSTCTAVFDFATPITGDVKVYAKWTEIKPDHPAFNDAKTVNGVAVTVSAPEGVFPKGSYLSVESVPVSAQSMVDEAVENERDANANVAVSYTFDIKVLDTEGNEVQPADAQSVKVSFGLAEAKDDNLEAQVYHISDEGNAEVLDTSVNGDAVEAVTDGFSFYTVEFTYGTMTYVLPGGSEVKLSDVLSYVGLSGEVTAASGSNDELFSITKESGEWMIHSHQPFNTEEKLSVTINGIVYEIIVTDTNVSGTIYASSLADNDNLVLTGDTTLVMDVPKTLKSISGDYALTIEGSQGLIINATGDAISVKSLSSSVFMDISAGGKGLNIKNDINLTRLLIIDSNDVGVYSEIGDIKHHSTANIQSKTSYAIFVENGNIELNGDITATGRLGGIYANGKDYNSTRRGRVTVIGTLKVETGGLAGSGVSGESGVTLEGEINVINKNKTGGNGITSGGLVTLSGNISSEALGYRAISGDSVIVKNGSSIIAKGKEGIYAKKKIEMEGGDLEATGTERHAIFVENGSIELNGDITATGRLGGIYANGKDYYRGQVTVIGTLKVETEGLAGSGVSGESGVTLEGEINVINKNKTGGNGITSGGLVTLSGNISSEAPGYRAIFGDSVIIKNGSSIIAKGEEGIYAKKKIEMEGGDLEATGTERHAIFVENGSIELNGDITATGRLGGIYAKGVYDQYTPRGHVTVIGTLKVETEGLAGSGVSGESGVTLEGEINVINKNKTGGNGITSGGLVTLSGNISSEAPGYRAISGDSVIIKNGSSIIAKGKEGIYAKKKIEMEGGGLEATGTNGYAILASKDILINDGYVHAKGTDGAIYSNDGTIITSIAITIPSGGRVSGKTIVGTDGKIAKEVIIQNRPLPGSVSIANGVLAEVGDVLTLDFSSDFPWSGRSVQWQKEVGGGTWEDIPGETNWSYVAKAADQGRAFRVRVSVAGYSGEKFSNSCTILVKPTLGGTVTYSNSGYNSVFGYAYLNDVVSAVTSNMTPSGIPNNRLRFTWQTSADGSTGWTDISGATSSSYKTKAGDHGKYIRVVVSAQGYTGTVNGPALKVRKSAAVAVIAPDLDISGDQVRVKDAQPNQEYLIFSSKQNTIPESAWASAQSPDTVSALYLGGTANSVNYVYTRVKETENSYAGAVASSSIYLGSTTYLQDFYLNVTFMRGGVEYTPEQDEMGRYNIRQGDVLKIDAVPVPSDATDYWGISGQNWLVDNRQTGQSTYGGYFRTASGTYDQIQPSESYKTVYFKPNQLKNGVTLSASLSNSSIGYKYDEIKVNVGTEEGEFLTDNLYVESNITIRKGDILEGFSFSTTPETATTGTMTAQLTDGAGTAPVITFAPENRTFAVNAEEASVGTYKFNVSCQNGTATASLTVTVISDECTVTLSANNGNPAENITQTVKIGSEFILPELPDSFTKPSDFDFGGWDKGAVGEGIHIEGDTVINANWIAHVHNMEFVPGFEPTCVWDGNAEHYHCTVCGKDFDDADGSSEAPTADYYIIPATGHTPGTAVKEKEIDATCTEAGGYDEVVYCTVCHDELSRTHTDISATGHSLTLVPAKSATCTEDGNHAYYECSVCGDWFEDATGAVKITDYLSVIIDALGHDWGEWVQTKAPTTTEEGEETRTCSRCGETETRSIPKLGVTSYEIIVNVGAHGSAHASAGASEEGKTITITATPDSGYEIDKITYTPEGGTATDITSTKSFTMPAAKVTVDVSFKASSVTPPGPITVTGISIATPGKTAYTVGDALDVSGMEIKVNYSDGTSKTIPVTAAMVSGFDSSAPATSQTLTITYEGKTTTYDVSISATAPVTYDITVNVGANGTASASAASATAGTTITVTATPDSGYEIDKITWTPEGGTATDITSTKSFTMPAAKVTVDVSFKASSVTPPGPTAYTVTFKDGESTLSTVTVNSGEKVTKPADPTKTGYTFNGWYADATFTAAFDFDQPITANTTVYAKFTENSVTPPATITYTVTGGADSTWTKGSSSTVTITVKRSEADDTCFSHFTGVEIDGVALAAGDYEAVSGSTVVTLKASALQKLSNGSHTVTVKFDDGKASTGLTVKAASGSTDKPTSPKTGDESNLRLWVLLMLMSILGFITTVAVGRKKRQHSR